MLKTYCILVCLVWLSGCQAVLNTYTLTDVDIAYVNLNTVGLAVSWDIHNYHNVSLLETIIQNSNSMNSWSQTWAMSILPTDGTDYECLATDTYCTENITTAQMVKFGPWVYNNLPQPGYTAGIQMHSPNATRLSNFITNLTTYSKYSFMINLGSEVDKYASKGFRSSDFNMTKWLQEVIPLYNQLNVTTSSGIVYVTGPGISVNSKTWMGSASQLFSNFNGTNTFPFFTVTMNFFQNDTDTNIENLLSESYLRNRFDTSFRELANYTAKNYIGIERLKLHFGNGKDGVTNTFAATLWAIDFIFEWVTFGGSMIHFHTDFSSNDYQSPFHSVSNFTAATPLVINPIYYGMLVLPFLEPLYSGSLYLKRVIPVGATSANIKVYLGQKSAAKDLHAVIINKDMDMSLQGYVRLCYPTNLNATYFYVEASSLNEKDNIFFQNYTFKGSTDGRPTGEMKEYQVSPNFQGCFDIPIKYCQVAVVTLSVQYEFASDQQFKTEIRLWNPILCSSFLLLILMCLVS